MDRISAESMITYLLHKAKTANKGEKARIRDRVKLLRENLVMQDSFDRLSISSTDRGDNMYGNMSTHQVIRLSQEDKRIIKAVLELKDWTFGPYRLKAIPNLAIGRVLSCLEDYIGVKKCTFSPHYLNKTNNREYLPGARNLVVRIHKALSKKIGQDVTATGFDPYKAYFADLRSDKPKPDKPKPKSKRLRLNEEKPNPKRLRLNEEKPKPKRLRLNEEKPKRLRLH